MVDNVNAVKKSLVFTEVKVSIDRAVTDENRSGWECSYCKAIVEFTMEGRITHAALHGANIADVKNIYTNFEVISYQRYLLQFGDVVICSKCQGLIPETHKSKEEHTLWHKENGK